MNKIKFKYFKTAIFLSVFIILIYSVYSATGGESGADMSDGDGDGDGGEVDGDGVCAATETCATSPIDCPCCTPDAGCLNANAADYCTTQCCDPGCGYSIRCGTTVCCASNAGQSCGSCGGTWDCTGTICSVSTPSNYGQGCGSCGGTITCSGACSISTPSNYGQSCGNCGTIGCSGNCINQGSCSPSARQCIGSTTLVCGGNCQWQIGQNCDSLDGWYGGGNTQTATCGSADNDASSVFRNYGCSSGSCTYSLTQTADCDSSDGWYGGGNNAGCGSDPNSVWNDYYVVTNTNSCTSTTSCTGTNSVNCDSQDLCTSTNKCEGTVFTSASSMNDYYVVSNSNSCTTLTTGTPVTENCATKTSTDSDGSSTAYTAPGSVTDYSACTLSGCTGTTHPDSCSGTVLTEYGASGDSFVSGNYECQNYESNYCSNYKYLRQEWGCSGTPGYCNGAAVSDTQAGTNADGDARDLQCGDSLCDNAPGVYDSTKTSTETACSDGLDNDCDTFIDGADPNCQAVTTETCTDGIDNDGDGRIDCTDTDCAGRTGPGGALCCQTAANCLQDDCKIESCVSNICQYSNRNACATTECAAGSYCDSAGGNCAQLVEVCTDSIDNDCDGLIDGADSNCQAACTPTGTTETAQTGGSCPAPVVRTSGTSWTVPSGVTSIKVWAIGAGGGAAGSISSDGTSGGAGGAGGVAYGTFNVASGQVVSYSIGSGGTGGTGAVNGNSGSLTSATIGSLTVRGNGGSGGIYNTGVVAAGGTFSGGDGGALGGYGTGAVGDTGGGGGGGIGVGIGTEGGTAGDTGGQSVDVSGLQSAVTSAGYSWTAPGAGGGSDGSNPNFMNGYPATGFGSGGGGAGWYGGNGGAGRFGGGGGGAAGYTATQTGGAGGPGAVVISPICTSQTACTDSIDNDCDTFIDGADSDCQAACTPTQTTETACTDNLDNDCDGLIDGADSDCQAVTTETCTDGIDNDGDSLTDCQDTDCAGSISGNVQNTDGNNINGARVDALQVTALKYTAFTNSLGNYQLNAVLCGTYNMVASASGYMSSTQTNVNLPPQGSVTVDLALVEGGICETDCTYTGDNIVHKECDMLNGCSFYDATAADVCNFAQPGWIRDYSETQELECAEGAPYNKIETEATVTCERENLIRTAYVVTYRGEPVTMIVVTCG